jgi:hypothetical protein
MQELKAEERGGRYLYNQNPTLQNKAFYSHSATKEIYQASSLNYLPQNIFTP